MVMCCKSPVTAKFPHPSLFIDSTFPHHAWCGLLSYLSLWNTCKGWMRVCVWLPSVHSSARMAALSASLALPLHLNKHHLSWLVVYKICQEAATQWSRDSDLRPQGAADGMLRWQGVSPVDPHADTPLRSQLKRLAALPYALEMRWGALQDATNSHEDRINTSFGDACHQDWWFPGIFVVVLSVL